MASASPSEGRQGLAPVLTAARQTVEQPALHAPRLVSWRQPGQRETKIRLERRICGFEPAAAHLVNQPGHVEIEVAFRIGGRRTALRLHMQTPAGSKALERIVEPGADGHQFVLGRGFQVGPAKAEGRQKGAVLVQDHAGRDRGAVTAFDPLQTLGRALDFRHDRL